MNQETISYGQGSLMCKIMSMVASGQRLAALGGRTAFAVALLFPLSAAGAVDSDRPSFIQANPTGIQANPTGLPQIINDEAPAHKFHPNHVLVRFRPATPELMRDTAHKAAQAQRVLKRYRFVPDLRLVEVPTGSVAAAMAAYRANPHVLYAEPDYTIELSALPDDPHFNLLWGMSNTGQEGDGPFCFPQAIPGFDVRAVDAWNLWTGDPNFRIAVIDTGIDYLHPDLAPNVWTNPLEAPGDANGDGCPGVCGVDDDHDGLIDEDSFGRQPDDPGYSNDLVDDDDENSWPDDIHGYDMFNGDGDPMDDNGHGSHVSGTIGAVGNNGIGVAGLNWQCKIVALKMFGSDGSGANVSEAIAAMEYVIAGGIRVSNNSWGFANGFSQALYDVIAAAQAVGHVFVTAAGNNFGLNIDTFPRYPAAYDLGNIITVAAMDNHGTLAAFSNIGPVSVDLAAPGSCIFSTLFEQGYGYKNGTSMATPHVTGAVALLTSLRPELNWMQVRAGILSTVRPLEAFEGFTATGGSLDVRSALGDCNGNGLFDAEDIGNGTSLDCTGNGIPDECERDCDMNGVADPCDVLVDPSLDCDGDGVLNSCEPDCNDNGISDDCEILDGSARDCNGNAAPDVCEIPSKSTAPGGPFFCTADCAADCNENGQPDSCDIDDGLSFDCTSNGVPDECEEDCNDNAVADSCDILNGLSADCTEDGVPDECEPDCNLNLVADSCDIAGGSSADCTGNGTPDECEPDCNLNEVADSCDIDTGLSRDCDGNGVPDECQVIDIPDCNGNGVLDSCDLLDGTSPDCNSNHVPDECDLRDGGSLDDNHNAVPDECDGMGLALVPVDATGPHVIQGNEIFLETPGQRVTFDIRISGWDLGLDGDPRLLAYQVQIGAAGFSSGLFGELSLAKLLCTSDHDCFEANVCEEEEQPGAERFCDVRASAYIDPSRSDYVFFNLISFRVTNHVFVAPDFWLLGALFLVADAVADDGTDKYAGTIVLDVPTRSGGTFTVGFTPRGTLFRKGFGQSITIPSMSPARITIPPDCNGNGVVDGEELANGAATDCNGNGVLDECIEFEADCNANGHPDACDIAAGLSTDCNGNGVPDECLELETDCNDNAVPDACDIDNQVSRDCNENTRPDECDIATDRSNDCNGNGIPDECTSLEIDCNRNGAPDDCDLDDGTSSDCNTNDIPDECDLAAGTSLDENANGVPDECQRTLRVPGDFPTIQEGIDASHDGDTVLVADGIYRGQGNKELNFWGAKIEVRSENGPLRCIIDCENEGRGIVFTNRETRLSRFSGFTISNGLENFGGAILLRRSSPTIANCRLVGNRAESMGGAVMCDETSDPLITHCIVADNTTAGVGAGFAIDGASDPDVRNCLIVRNIAGDNGGAFYCDNLSQPIINNCTITLNEARRGGGIYSARRVIFTPTFMAPIVRNSILWGDRVSEDGREIFLGRTAELIVGYSLIDQGLNGTVESSPDTLVWEEGNTSDYPWFVDPLGDDADQLTWQDNDYRLRPHSPAVGAGSPDFVPLPAETDLESHPRVLCERVDQGAYELGIGDFDCDMNLTLLDFAFWPTCHDGPGSLLENQACRSFDFDGDGDIDLQDYGALQRYYGN